MIFQKHISAQDIELYCPTAEMAQDLCDLICHNQSEFKYIDDVKKKTNITECENHLKSMAERFEEGNSYGYMIFKGKVLVGYAGIKIRQKKHVAEISYFLDKRHTGNGYATKAVKALEDTFFNQGGHRCEIFCNEMNENSRRLAKRLGYQLDGIMREYEFIDGAYQGVAIYSKIREMKG